MESSAAHLLIIGEPPTIVQGICIAVNTLNIEKLRGRLMMQMCDRKTGKHLLFKTISSLLKVSMNRVCLSK